MSHYIALIHKEPGSDYGVSFPDFPGCITVGTNLDEARARAAEVLAFHVDGMTEDGDAVPDPSGLEQIMADRENRDGVAILVPLQRTVGTTVRVDVTIDADVLDRIDRFAAERGMTRSGFLTVAARRVLEAEAPSAAA